MICGIFVLLKEYKRKLGTWIICFSLSIFVGGNLQIENLVSNTFNITEKIKGIESKIQKLDIKVNQTVALKNEMSQTVNVITEVKKEIENIHEAIEEFYKQTLLEIFTKKDLGKRVMVCDSMGMRVVCFQLKKIPIYKSVSLTNERGTVSPSVLNFTSNILLFRTNDKTETILAKEKHFFSIYYTKDYRHSDAQLYTVEGMQCLGTKDNPDYARFPALIPDKESNLTGQSSTKNKINLSP